jgi:hypothetical protein
MTRGGVALCWGDLSPSLLVDPARAETCGRSKLFGDKRCVPSPAEVRPPG